MRAAFHSRLRAPLMFTTAVMLGMTAPTADAQQAGDTEEIIVTARKRAESLQDAPASILAYQGEDLQAEGFVDLQTLSATVPNFHYSNATGANDILTMRGLGTVGSGPHFEPAVGQVFNGYFASRSRVGRAAFMDVGQVEVLRGPQGAIIGKNTTLGAVNVTPAKPTSEFEAYAFASYDFEDREGVEVEGVVSGPIAPSLRARLAANYKDRDGTIENLVTGQTAQTVEDLSARLIVEADVGENAVVEFFAQRSDFDRLGSARELSFCNDPAAVLAAIGDDCTINGTNVNVNLVNGVDVGEPFRLESNMFGLAVNVDFERFTFTWLTGFQEYVISDQFDSDLSFREVRTIGNEEEYEQVSQELRIASSGQNTIDYILGAFFLKNSIDFVQDADFQDAPANGGPLRRRQIAVVDTENTSVFGELTWNINPQWSLTGGVRYTQEDREGAVRQTNYTIYTLDNEGARCGGGGFRICHDVMGDISEDDVSWNTSLQWRPLDGAMFYGAAATGFKSGAFNLLSGFNQALLEQVFEFGPEDSLNLEIGGRHDLFGRRLRLSWTVFDTKINDLQVSQNEPTVIAQIITNAGEASAQGVEFDGNWFITDAFELAFSGAFLDAAYEKFDNAPCFAGQTAAQGCAPNSAGQLVQDLAGEDTTRAPEWQFTVDANYAIALGANLELRPNVRWFYVDDHVLAVDNDPRSIQEAYSKWDASITLGAVDNRWSVSLVGRNLSEEFTRSFDDLTAAINGFGGGGRFAGTDEGRTVAIKARVSY